MVIEKPLKTYHPCKMMIVLLAKASVKYASKILCVQWPTDNRWRAKSNNYKGKLQQNSKYTIFKFKNEDSEIPPSTLKINPASIKQIQIWCYLSEF